MAKRNARAVWKGDLKSGNGEIELGSGVFKGQYTFASRFEQQAGTNPEELIAAAHAGCFSMALAAGLTKGGHQPQEIRTTAEVSLEQAGQGFSITSSHLQTVARVPGISEADFMQFANDAKTNCPVSKALAGLNIELDARLES